MAEKKLDIVLKATGDAQTKRALEDVEKAAKRLAEEEAKANQRFNQLGEMLRGGGMLAGYAAASNAIFGVAKAMRELADASQDANEKFVAAASDIPVIGRFFDFAFSPAIEGIKKRRQEMLARRAAASESFGIDETFAAGQAESTGKMRGELDRIEQGMNRSPLSPFNDRIEALGKMLSEAKATGDAALGDRIVSAIVMAEKQRSEFIAKEAEKEREKIRESERKARDQVNDAGRKFFEGLAGGFVNFGEGLRGAAFAKPEAEKELTLAAITRSIAADTSRGTTGALAAAREPIQAAILKKAEEASKERVSILGAIQFMGEEITVLKNQFLGIRV